MRLTVDELLAEFKAMTLTELHEFVRRFEETFGVSAAFIVPSDAMRGRVEVERDTEDDEDLPDSWDVALVGYEPEQKIKTIKEIRVVTGLGLREAKNVVDTVQPDGVPSMLLTGVPLSEAETCRSRLNDVGATVEVRRSGEGPEPLMARR